MPHCTNAALQGKQFRADVMFFNSAVALEVCSNPNVCCSLFTGWQQLPRLQLLRPEPVAQRLHFYACI